MYQPQGTLQTYISIFCKASFPYISYFTYKYQAERARAVGIRIEDMYENKFFREPYITWHIYAQYFHPTTLLERVREVSFYRKTNTLFKGFAVPEWAQNHKRSGFDVDIYSRLAWKSAMQDLKSEWTPQPFDGDRLGPNVINLMRHEHWGKGHSSRFFYNEQAKPTLMRHGGQFNDAEKTLFSFKYADQEHDDLFGFDNTTPEGREQIRTELRWWKEMTPELFEDIDVDGEIAIRPFLSQEPHFRRVWNHYRQFQFNARVQILIEQGNLDQTDITRAAPFFDTNGLPSANMYSLAQRGLLGDVSSEPSFEAFTKVLKWLGLNNITYDDSTAMPQEEQFWEQFDQIFELNEQDLHRYLDVIVADPRTQAKIAAGEFSGELGTKETTRRIA